MEQLLILMPFQLSYLQLWLLPLMEAAMREETIRAAILSVDPGEIEAARSLGMTNRQVYRRIIIPNAAVVATLL